MTAAATRAISISQAFCTARSVAAEIFATFKPTLDVLAPDEREKECEAAIRYAAHLIAGADVSESSHAEVAKRSLTECLQRSLRYVAPDNVVEFPGRAERRTALSLLPIINGDDLLAKSAVQVWFLVTNMIQGRKVNLLMGEDGSGKSYLTLQLAFAKATGGEWLGFKLQRGPVIFYTAEEEIGDLKVRLRAIAKTVGVENPDLSDLHLIPMGGEETAVLGEPSPSGKIQMTKLLRSLVYHIETIKPKLVILDPLNEVFDGDELKRVQARQFVGLLRPIAATHDLAIVVTGHPSVTGVRERTGTSGSTGWSAVMRGRLYLEKVKAEDGVTDTGERMLTIMKLSGGQRPSPIDLVTGEGGVLVRRRAPTVAGGKIDFDAIMAEAERPKKEFLELLGKLTKQNINVSPSPNATNYAPKIMVKREDHVGRTRKSRIAELEQAMNELLDEDRIENQRYGAKCRGTYRLVAAPGEVDAVEQDSSDLEVCVSPQNQDVSAA